MSRRRRPLTRFTESKPRWNRPALPSGVVLSNAYIVDRTKGVRLEPELLKISAATPE